MQRPIDCEDARGDACLELIRKHGARGFTEIQLKARARYRMWDYFRRHRRELLLGETGDEKRSTDVGPEQILLARERSSILEQAIGELPSKWALAVRRHYLDGETVEELASKLAVSEGQVRNWLHRGKKRLRENSSLASLLA